MATVPPSCEFGLPIPAFTLPATDGKIYALSDIRGENGTLIVFICNHCPYVLGAIDRIMRDARELEGYGIGTAVICSNDAETHPGDSFENMKKWAEEKGFPFPYLHDEDQSVARAFEAQCTPDFFGYNADGELQYRGRIDAAGKKEGPPDTKRELFEAMKEIAETGKGPEEQTPSMGCSIKWKAA